MDENKIESDGGEKAEEQDEMKNAKPADEFVEAGDIESLAKAIEEERAKAERYMASWQRSQADFINYKRRTEQERGDIVRLSNANLIFNLLPVLDDMERALESISDKLAGFTWVDGIVIIYRKLKAILEANGVSEIKAAGAKFDPVLHEAVVHVEGEEGKVIEVLQKGYMINDRVLRPAMVKVGNGNSSGSNEKAEKHEKHIHKKTKEKDKEDKAE
jgi:molecular chaperone GrpE